MSEIKRPETIEDWAEAASIKGGSAQYPRGRQAVAILRTMSMKEIRDLNSAVVREAGIEQHRHKERMKVLEHVQIAIREATDLTGS